MRSNFQDIKQELANDAALEQCARQCGVMGDMTKLKICYILRHYPDLPVGTIAELAGTSVSNASHSLARLRAANLVECNRQGQCICYRLTDNNLATALLDFVT